MQKTGLGMPEPLGADPVCIHGKQLAADSVGAVYQADLFIGFLLQSEDGPRINELGDQTIKIFRTGADDDLLRFRFHSPVAFQIGGDGFAQFGTAGVRRAPEELVSIIVQHLPDQAKKGGYRKIAGRAGGLFPGKPAASDILQLHSLRDVRSDASGGERDLAHEKAAPGAGDNVPFIQKLSVSPFHGDHADPQMLCQGPFGRQLFPGLQRSLQDIFPDLFIEIFKFAFSLPVFKAVGKHGLSNLTL